MIKAIQKMLSGSPMRRMATKVLSRNIRGRYDAAQTNADNRKHWSNADFLSADAEASSEVRKILRQRSRYECQNNSYAKGIISTLANDTVGTGARLQMLSEDEELDKAVEKEFMQWALEINLAEKLRTMRLALALDGEAFAMFITNPRLMNDVKLDIVLIDADRVTGSEWSMFGCDEIDGIAYDMYGNPRSYRVLKEHPSEGTVNSWNESAVIPADMIIHLFRQDRPEQHRGVPEITPALPLFAQLRRFTLAVLAAAESAADFAGILHTDAPANGESADVEPMDSIELERNMLLTMPAGWKMSQVEPSQPATTYAEFKREILNEIARCLNMPFNVAAGNSSGYNYASGRLDHQTYYKSIRVTQSFMASRVLDRILQAFMREYDPAMMIPAHGWFWDGMEHVDPAKEATAQEKKLKNFTSNLASEYAKQGKDWESELRQIAREKSLMRELGISVEESIQNEEEPNKEGEEDGE